MIPCFQIIFSIESNFPLHMGYSLSVFSWEGGVGGGGDQKRKFKFVFFVGEEAGRD